MKPITAEWVTTKYFVMQRAKHWGWKHELVQVKLNGALRAV